MKWMHLRKGEISGEVVVESNEWVTIRLAEPVAGKKMGETVTIRRALITPISSEIPQETWRDHLTPVN